MGIGGPRIKDGGAAGMDGAWPKVLERKMKSVRLRGNKEKVCVFETREYPAGTEGGRYQLWIDGRWAEDITRNMEATKGAEVMSYLDGHIAETALVLEEDDQGKVYYSRTFTPIPMSVSEARLTRSH